MTPTPRATRTPTPNPTPLPPDAHLDLAPLLALFNATEGTYWTKNDLWHSDRPLQDWHGVTTNAEGRVTKIELGYNALNGTIPPELSQLQYLEHLNLYYNKLTGNIPQSLADLPNLNFLDLSSNLLDGPIPARIGSMKSLTHLTLSNNQFSGQIPSSLVASQSIRHLSLAANELTGGIPREFHITSQLLHINLSHNRLTFEIPFEIERLRWLNGLFLNHNQLTGQIPPSLGKLSQLERLDLRYNQLTGPISSELAQMERLRELSLDNNLLSGTIPSELADVPSLTYLGVADNHFIGCIPIELRNIERSNAQYANVTYCDEPLRADPYSPPYIKWAIGDTVTPSQELAARMGVERIAKFVEKVGWPIPSETITVYFGDLETIARSYAAFHQSRSCDIACARREWRWQLSGARPGAVFTQTWDVIIGSLDENAWRVAQQTMEAIHLDWRADVEPLADVEPSWWVGGLTTLIDRLADAEQRGLTYSAHRSSLRGPALEYYKPLADLEQYDRYCSHACSAMALEILASQVGLRALANYYTQRPPGTSWKQNFENTFNITVLDFYDLYREHYEKRFPYLELPIEGSTQWPWHDATTE